VEEKPTPSLKEEVKIVDSEDEDQDVFAFEESPKEKR